MRGLISCLVVVFVVACGGDSTPPGANNGAPSNGLTNNGVSNNGTSSNNGEMPGVREVASIELEPAQAVLRLNQTQKLVATARDADREPMPGVELAWSSSDESVAEVTEEGVVIARTTGTALIEASTGEVTGTASIEVAGEAVVSIEVQPADPSPIAIGRTIQLSVALFDRLNAPIDEERPVTFTSQDETVATVSPNGLVRGVEAGTAIIHVEVEGVEASVSITVLPPQLTGVELDPTQSTLVPGDTTTLSALLSWADDIAPEQQPDVAWTIDKPEVATIDAATGEVTAVAVGTATVTATVEGSDYSFANAIEVVFDFSSVTAGGAHACGLVRGVAFCWGANDAGQLGRPVGTEPARVETALRFQQLSAGGAHTCGLTDAGIAYCWGDGAQGQLGHGVNQPSTTPEEVAGAHVFTSVVAGDRSTCAVDASGELWCWGDGADSRLGTGSAASQNTPQNVGMYTNVAAYGSHACAIDSALSGFCWGLNTNGQLGLNNTTSMMSPAEVSGGFRFGDIVTGASHTCANSASGATLCWGANDAGQVGDNSTTERITPVLISSATLSRLTAGRDHTCALTNGGAIRCWGRGANGRLGHGNTMDSTQPVAAMTVQTFFAIDAGDDFTCAISTTAEPYCWGAGAAGQLGTTSTNSMVPVPVTGF